MRVKVGDTWHEVTAETPICVELTAVDRRNIGNMADWATKYAAFSDDDPRESDGKIKWMEG